MLAEAPAGLPDTGHPRTTGPGRTETLRMSSGKRRSKLNHELVESRCKAANAYCDLVLPCVGVPFHAASALVTNGKFAPSVV